MESARAKHKVAYASLMVFLAAAWCYPKHLQQKSRSLHQLFSVEREKSNRKAGAFKASSSETLGLYPMVHLWIARHIKSKGWMPKEVYSFERMCRAADIMRHNRGCIGELPREEFLQAAECHLKSFKEAYPLCKPKPKHHLTGHLMEAGLDCWVCERSHGMTKLMTESIGNTVSWEQSAIVRVIAEKQRRLDDPLCFADALTAPIEHSAELSELAGCSVSVSAGMVCAAGPLHRDDVIKVCNSEITAGIVIGCLLVSDVLGIILEELEFAGGEEHAAVYTMIRTGTVARLPYDVNTRIVHATAWDHPDEGRIDVVW